jgi:hypothetical protein
MMTNSVNLHVIMHGVQETGKFEKSEILAVLSNLIDIADRLEILEVKCEIQPPSKNLL